MTALALALALAWLVILALAIVVLALARQVGVLHQRIGPAGALLSSEGPRRGEFAPEVAVTALSGDTLTFGGPASRPRSSLTLFVSPDCPLCKIVIPVAQRLAREEGLDLWFASDGERQSLSAMAGRNNISLGQLVVSPELGRRWAVDKLPHAVLIAADGRIVARGLVNSREHLESMVAAQQSGHGSIQDFLKAEVA
jgi:methylamine dehydrogenase accessory protein MauD